MTKLDEARVMHAAIQSLLRFPTKTATRLWARRAIGNNTVRRRHRLVRLWRDRLLTQMTDRASRLMEEHFKETAS